ncbi:MAG: hypothetical protein ACT4QF_06565 [Sporichthyaceae bacterium]
METVVVSRTFPGDVDKFVAYTRTLDSRTCWPGTVLEYSQPAALHYAVGMRLSAAAMTDINVEDRLGDVERLEDGEVRYSTSQRVLWPDGHADAITEYRFVPGEDGGENLLQFTYSYPPPSTKLVKTKALPAFRAAMEKVSSRYLKMLVDAGGR